MDRGLLGGIEPFPTGQLVPYDTSYLSGYVVEHYQVVLIDAVKQSRDSMHEQLERLCAAEIPGDTHRNLRIFPKYSGETFKHILVPVWVLGYTYSSAVYQVVANGYTGKIAGQYPKSPWKIAAAVLMALIILLIIVFFAEGQ
ncbi:MAG: hypothetical protein EHM13_06580 [Acidobacteria bacterium]|nr:MAG: hypothetical protein EHM13_06580 [Acidobacteriota bacterium]